MYFCIPLARTPSTVGEPYVPFKEPGMSGLMFSKEGVLENIELKENIT